MKRVLDPCGAHRENLALLACDALTPHERAALENHLANCPECRKCFEALKGLVAPLRNWENAYAGLQPSQAAQSRWKKDFEEALEPDRSQPIEFARRFLNWCQDMIWPCRRIWAGFAAVWIVVLGFDISQRRPAESDELRFSRPSVEMVRAFLEHDGFFGKRGNPNQNQAAQPLPPASTPRSERPVEGTSG